MKILIIHNFYQSSSPSGEDIVFKNEGALLRDKGIHVITYEKFNKDKFWSFTDCTSKAIMEILDITQVFSFDKNFEQMGFERKP